MLGFERNVTALRIVTGIAVAITSIPVISRIFIDLGVMNTKFARTVLTTSTIHDVVLWVVLAIATGLVGTRAILIEEIIVRVAATVLFFVVSLWLMPRMVTANAFGIDVFSRHSVFTYILVICFAFSAVASLLEVNLVFGAFLAGIVVGRIPNQAMETARNSIKENAMAFPIPVYFALVGLKIDLSRSFDPYFFVGFILFAMCFQTLGTLIAARALKRDWLTSFNYAVAMNTRGGPGIILASVALELGIINEGFFACIVGLSLITALIAGTWFKLVLSSGWELAK